MKRFAILAALLVLASGAGAKNLSDMTGGGMSDPKAEAAAADKARAKLPKACRNITDRELLHVRKKSAFVGMTETAARCAWGKPEHVNRTTTSYGVNEQWVYGNSYLYLRDGQVYAIQN